ncbi:hypothetical protein M407DRAFT_210776 [Tulasnella calospora MUT 4182]|uniref:H-type lectin domain-containing protein n=1 Tax=Tulasnella calospora MUT 4182 TaxID=1051891 RepID=A0A0C3Q6Z8_9AGAM|nr:hypothetical protein M407DRAFT_210776 [Tulasnella calospora MUT 4182]
MSAVSSFNTQQVHLWNKPQQKTSKTLNFPQTYVAPPRCVVGLNSLDMKAGTNLRVKAYESAVDSQRYTANIDTWGDTTLFSASTDALILKPANLDIQSGQFSTVDDHPWNEPKLQTSRRINFERPFVTPPKVVVFLQSFDTAGSGTSTRLRTYHSDIDAKGFTIHIDTWSDTTLYSAIAGWIAYPEDKDYIYSGTTSTMDVRPWQDPQLQTYKDITFQNTQFHKKPTVFLALNSIDISTGTNLRIRAHADNITTGGLTWHIDSWADTKLWSAGISYIAFN